ncbi:MAG: helix-turn-helix transcriptional regulator [Ruminococcaceae bacterium]|nr:helix-turn-helix transcriptional regulator [Oscillospiraceae bacterium]
MMDIENQLRDLFFHNILGGGYYSEQSVLEDDARQVGLSFPYSGFVVASVRVEEWGNPFVIGQSQEADGMRDMFFILRNVFQDTFSFDGCVAQGANYKGKFVVIINSDFDDGWMDKLREKSEYVVDMLDREFDLSVVVAFGRPSDSLIKISRAYEDTEDVHDYVQVINEDMRTVFYDDLTPANKMQSDLSYIELQSNLRGCIRRFDTDGARYATSELISREFYDSPPTIHIFRFRVYGLVNSLLYILEELRAVMGAEEYEKLNVGPRLTEASTLNEILTEVEGIYDQLDEYAQNRDGDTQPKWVAKIRQYIDENFSDVNVTVSSAANHFGMTPSYCTRAFKRYIGLSLFDYIQQKRIEAAKKLLAQNMSLTQVCEQVGFSSTLTMNRAFKRYEGVSPGKFKNM